MDVTSIRSMLMVWAQPNDGPTRFERLNALADHEGDGQVRPEEFGPQCIGLTCHSDGLIRFITWNLDWWNSGERAVAPIDLIDRYRPDIVALQEVRGRSIARDHDGTTLFSQETYPPATWRWMGCALLLKPGIDVLDVGVIEALPKPQRSLWARIVCPDGMELTVVSWHSPNRAGDGLDAKMAAFATMNDWLASAPRPVVVGADLNTWFDPAELEPPDPDAEHHEELAFVGADPPHGLVDAYRTVLDPGDTPSHLDTDSNGGPLAISHVLSNGVPHRMDRIHSSTDLVAQAAGYDLEGIRSRQRPRAPLGGPQPGATERRTIHALVSRSSTECIAPGVTHSGDLEPAR